MAIGYNPTLVTNGLVLCLDAGNIKSYLGSGTTWTDQISNANNGTLQGSPGFSSLNGGVITFNGTNQYADCGYNPIIYNLTTNFSVEAWVRWTGAVATTGNGQWMLANVDHLSSTIGGFQLGYVPSLGIHFSTYGNLQQASSGTVPVINTWYHLVGVKSSTFGYVIYVNGVSAGTNAATTNAGVGQRNLRIAHRERDGASAGYFPGYIPSVKIYNVALTASQVQQNFNALRGRFGI